MFEATKNKASLTERPILMDPGFIIPSRRSSMFFWISLTMKKQPWMPEQTLPGTFERK